MGSFAPKGHAKLDPQHPAAFANCEMCGFLYLNRELKWEVQWTGMEIRRTGHLVCERCWDAPNYSVRAKTLPADPVPILNPRSEAKDKPSDDLGYMPPKIP